MLNLQELPYAELKTRVRDRLAGLSAGGPPVDPRIDAPYDWLVESYRRGSEGFQLRFSEVLGELLQEVITEEGGWGASAENRLFAVVRQCGHGLVSDLHRWVEGLDPGSDRERDRLALMLKALLALGRHGTVAFWLEQHGKLRREYGALIFAGLVEQGLEVAVRYLPVLCQDDGTCGRIEAQFPALCNRFGSARVDMELGKLDEPLRSKLQGVLHGPEPVRAGVSHPAEPVAAIAGPARSSPDTRELAEALY